MEAEADSPSPARGWTSPHRITRIGILLILVLLLSLRFWNLQEAPPGFYVDEAAIAAQVICVRQSGRSLQGEPWPLFAEVLGGGQASAPTLYLGAAWTTLFGDSVAAFRGLAAAAGLIILAAVAWTSRQLSPRSGTALLVLLTAASSPWLFHLSRVFWDPILGAALWASALAVYFTARSGGRRPRHLMLWGLFGALSMLAAYAYPPVRIQVACSWLLMACLDRGLLRWPGWCVAGLSAGLIGAPLLLQYLDPGFRARGAMLAIWNEGWLSGQGKRVIDLPWILVDQLRDHLHPRYLFFSGDGNLRHGSRYGGLIGPVELFIIAAAALVIHVPRRETLLLLALVFAGLLPAALTWESTPHALRSLGAVGPWLMLVGLFLGRLLSEAAPPLSKRLWVLIPLIATAAMTAYWQDYTQRYAQAARPWFDADARPLEDPRYPTLARRYFELQGGERCHPE